MMPELKGLSRIELALLVALSFMFIFAGALVYLFYSAKIDFTIAGKLDVNTIMVVFLGIVNSVVMWLGLSRRIKE